MNDLAVLQYADKPLRSTQYKGISLYVVKDILRSIVDVPEEELCSFWRELKKQLDSEGPLIYTVKYHHLILMGLWKNVWIELLYFRIVQSIDSPQAETFKQWFAQLAEGTY